MRVTGTMVNYYFFCKRQLWYFIHNIHFEDSENLKIGRYFHELSQDEKAFGNFHVDRINGETVIEYKKKNTSENASRWQLLFYLSELRKKGIERKGVLKFKENRDNRVVQLTARKEKRLERVRKNIQKIARQKKPPPECKNCERKGSSYYDYFAI